jgi:hypothetical protein
MVKKLVIRANVRIAREKIVRVSIKSTGRRQSGMIKQLRTGAFWIEGWQLKGSYWIVSNKSMICNTTDADFEPEPLKIAVSRADAEWMRDAMKEEGSKSDE